MDGQAPVISDTPAVTSNSAAGSSFGRFTLRVGVAYTPAWGWLSAQLDYRPEPLVSPPWGERSTSNVRVGAVRDVSPSLRIGAGAFTDFDTSPRAASFRFDFVGASAGLTWRHHLELKTSDEHPGPEHDLRRPLRVRLGPLDRHSRQPRVGRPESDRHDPHRRRHDRRSRALYRLGGRVLVGLGPRVRFGARGLA